VSVDWTWQGRRVRPGRHRRPSAQGSGRRRPERLSVRTPSAPLRSLRWWCWSWMRPAPLDPGSADRRSHRT
jgi:hypothetical protein